jgi:predicted transglutaminase-like cysteine proteinase
MAGVVEARSTQAYLPLGDRVEAPRGFVEMCRRERVLCGAAASGSDDTIVTAGLADVGVIHAGRSGMALVAGAQRAVSSGRDTLTDGADSGDAKEAKSVIKLLRRVNEYVNGHVRQQFDLTTFGQDEYWQRSGTGHGAVGDCEDIAIEKRIQLIGQGFSAEKLAFAVVFSSRAGLHTVLVARTDTGDLVLDSRTPFVVRWQDAPYRWISVQAMGDPMRWQRLDYGAVQA